MRRRVEVAVVVPIPSSVRPGAAPRQWQSCALTRFLCQTAGVHRVVAVIADRVAPFELSIAATVFGGNHRHRPAEWYEFLVAAGEPPPLRSGLGIDLSPTEGLEALAQADTVIVPAWRDRFERPPEPFLEALRAATARGARIVSICSGAFVLGYAGILDGRRATTHWWYCADLAELFPRVEVDPDVLFVDEGDVLTSAGSAGGIDLCLHLVRRDHGVAVANGVARDLVVSPHREGGQAQYIEPPAAAGTAAQGLGATMAWAIEHLDQDLTVDRLAGHAAMSPRSFARRFREGTGVTPHRWLIDQRIDRARHLLESTDVSVDQIAASTGFASPATLRARFAERTSLTPTTYRAAYRSPAAVRS